MSCSRALLHGIHHLGLHTLTCVGLGVTAFSQGHYYVDSHAGSNFGAGTQASPWQTVDFALTGPPSPLPNGSTIHLLSSSDPYGYNSGDVFPWVLYGDISLVATPGGSGIDCVVEGVGSTSQLIVLSPTESFSACAIRGLTLRNAGTGISVTPASGVSQGLTIENCVFNALSTNIEMAGAVGSSLSPVVRNNSFAGGLYGISYLVQGCTAVGLFEHNDLTGAGTGFYFTGTPNSGSVLMVSYNQLSSTYYGGVGCYGFDGLVDVVHNTLIDSSIVVSSCSAWNPSSRIEFNGLSGVNSGGISIAGSSHVAVSDNTLSNTSGGIYTSSDSTVVRNTITGCSGYGIVVGGSGAVISNNVIVGSSGAYPALYVQVADATVVNNEIRNNGGVGIQDAACVGTLYARNVITGNAGHGVDLLATSTTNPPSIVNNTVADNLGNGIHTMLPTSVATYVKNCIVWNNNGTGCDIFGVAALQARYCDIQHCGPSGNGNINTDPLFVNAAIGDYHLQPGSPCINTGDPASPVDCDGSRADMGALATGACGVAFCAGDGTGTACPCGNSGLVGNGCANSINASGANLTTSGAASIAADTLVLTGSGMPNSSALYFQGTAQAAGGAGVVFGDGLRCVAGSVLRLGTKANAAGSSSFPIGADPRISIKGLVASPGVRFYQVWYRNAAAFCNPETFNLTNGLRVNWTL